jgi:hypothetical protein
MLHAVHTTLTHGGIMKTRNVVLLATAAALFGVAGCGGDIAKQIVSNEALRTQVMDVLVSHKDLALKTVDRFMANDTLRAAVVDQMLSNENAAKQVLIRIGTNPQALDMVMGVAVRDSAMRGHVVTLIKGVEMATQAQVKK